MWFLPFVMGGVHLHQTGLLGGGGELGLLLRFPKARPGLFSQIPRRGSVQSPPQPLVPPTPTHTPGLGGPLWRAAHQALIPRPCPASSHPQCPSKTFGTFSSTKDFPDDVIQFARNHPLMYSSILPLGGRPLFLQVGAGYTFTQIAADRVAAADGHYDVLFIGTGQAPLVQPPPRLSLAVPVSRCSDGSTPHSHRPTSPRGRERARPGCRGYRVRPSRPADAGTVLKVISVPKGSRPSDEGLLLEELHVFEVRPSARHRGTPLPSAPAPSTPSLSQDSAAVTSMQISSKRVSGQKAQEWNGQGGAREPPPHASLASLKLRV